MGCLSSRLIGALANETDIADVLYRSKIPRRRCIDNVSLSRGTSAQTNNLSAWIGSLQYCLMFLPAVFMGRLLDIGKFQIPFNTAFVTYIIAIFLSAECKEYWQSLLCQGLLLGMSAGTMFGPALAIVAHWCELFAVDGSAETDDRVQSTRREYWPTASLRAVHRSEEQCFQCSSVT